MAENHQDIAESKETSGLPEVPVCLRCFTPFDPLQHFCRHCGETVGQLTPYIPYLNIPFKVSIFSIMWKRVWFDKQTRLLTKIFFLFMIFYFAAVMYLGLPFALRSIIRKNHN